MNTGVLKLGVLLCALLATAQTQAQIVAPSFGKGIRITGADSTFTMKVGIRFQSLFTSTWSETGIGGNEYGDPTTAALIRRSRLKFDGWAVSPKFKYKCELALSNRDNGGGNSDTYNNAANVILDAWVRWNFYKGFSVQFGQGKWPGNRERIISSGNMQFVDRSRLNSRFTLDRDMGVMLLHEHKVGDNLVIREVAAVGSGEGKNITANHAEGYSYTGKVEVLPFGKFAKKGDYQGAALAREDKPKLAIAAAYELNQKAGRTRGQKGDFIVDSLGNAAGKDIETLFADFIFKYRGWSVMGEYAKRQTSDGNAHVVGALDEHLGTYYTGSAMNVSVGYLFKSNWEVAGRLTSVDPDDEVAADETQYTFGLSRYVVGHKLKVQTDVTYRDVVDKASQLMYRLQVDIHF